MEDMIDMQRSQCWLFENEGIDTPIVAENIAMITYAEDFSTMSSDAAIGNATVYFKDAMKTKYENWECSPTENCSGLYLTILSVSDFLIYIFIFNVISFMDMPRNIVAPLMV